MKRGKLLLENILIYGFGGVIVKIIPFVMLPIITRIMPNSSYMGINDMFTVVVSFGTIIATMGMYDSLFRLYFEYEDEEYRKEMCSTAFTVVLVLSIVLTIVITIFRNTFSKIFWGSSEYSHLCILLAINIFMAAINTITIAPTRMQNNRKIYLLSNILTPLISYSMAIFVLLKGYYVTALPIATVVSVSVIGILFLVVNHSWFSIKKFKFDFLKKLLKIGLPLVPTFLIYSIFSSCDRLMITNMIGLEANGVYAVGSKMGQLSQLIYTAFTGGWQFFAFSTMKDDDQVELTSKIMEYLGVISCVAAIGMMAISRFLFSFLFEEEYFEGYIVSPYLFMAPLLLMLYVIISNQFLVAKKTWIGLIILVSSVSCNIMMNYLLIPIMGIEGAAIGTAFSYFLILFLGCIVAQKIGLIFLSKRFVLSTILLGIYGVLWRMQLHEDTIKGITVAVLFGGMYLVLYWKEIRIIKSKIVEKIK